MTDSGDDSVFGNEPGSHTPDAVARVARALCCPSGSCQIPADEKRDHLSGRVSICQAHSYTRDASAAIAAHVAALLDAGYVIVLKEPPVVQIPHGGSVT